MKRKKEDKNKSFEAEYEQRIFSSILIWISVNWLIMIPIDGQVGPISLVEAKNSFNDKFIFFIRFIFN